MHHLLEIFIDSTAAYGNYLWGEILHPHGRNYLTWLLALSAVAFGLEIALPWRKTQPRMRKDFWLDAFYMFFNFFLFNLVVYAGVSAVAVTLFHDAIGALGVNTMVAMHVGSLPGWAQLLLLFVLRDFLQFNVHRLLHAVPWLWKVHELHHSVTEMGFAAHLRYHWVETIVYRSLEYIPLAMIGFGIDDFMVVHLFALAIGHLNHSNIYLPLGPLRYLLNSPQMHIWHHVKALPAHRPHGINFGITLSVWDFIFRTAHVPESGRDIALGFAGIETFPSGFVGQAIYPFRARHPPKRYH